MSKILKFDEIDILHCGDEFDVHNIERTYNVEFRGYGFKFFYSEDEKFTTEDKTELGQQMQFSSFDQVMRILPDALEYYPDTQEFLLDTLVKIPNKNEPYNYIWFSVYSARPYNIKDFLRK